jgi:hypothetical protein
MVVPRTEVISLWVLSLPAQPWVIERVLHGRLPPHGTGTNNIAVEKLCSGHTP